MSIASCKPYAAATAALLAALLSPAAHAAAEAVTNGSFENQLSSWSAAGAAQVVCNTGVVGQCAALLRDFGSGGSLTQTLATVAGTSYSYSFWIDNGTNSDFKFLADNVAVYSLVNATDSIGYFNVTGSFVAAGASTTIAFSLHGSSEVWLDAVSVMGAVPTAAALPEPASLLLAGSALAGLGFSRRRRA